MTSPSNIEKLRQIESHLVDPELAIQMVEQTPDGIVLVDSSAHIQFLNRAAELLFGYHRSELFDQPIETLVPEAARAAHEGHRSKFLDDPRTRPMGLGIALKARRKDGSEFEAEINLSPIVVPQGSYVVAAIRKRR